MTLRLLATLAVLLLTVACSTSKRENIRPPRELEKFDATVPVSRLWSRSLGDVGAKPGLRLAPVLVDGRIYAVNTRGDVFILDAASGAEVARHRTGLPIASPPGIGEGVIAVGTLDGRIVVLDAQSGAERFSARLLAEVVAAPAVADGRVFVRSHDGRIQAFDLVDGRRAWLQEFEVPALSLRGNAALVHDRGYLLVGFDDGRVLALRTEDGATVWQVQVGNADGRSDLERLADVDGRLQVVDGLLYTVGYRGQVMAIDVATGQPRWARDLSSAGGVALGEHLFVSDADGRVQAVDEVGGGMIWSQDALEYRWLSSPAVVGGKVVVADFDGWLHWLDPMDGRLVARERIARAPVTVAPIASGDVVWVLASNGTLAAYRVGG
ncbi:MAG: outer membrane protein assembly factor BamB [Xanthomonadales bacterium]|nr:outer membrane protein assembly factor BamB [Xanthomonadales bacterium]